MMTNDDHEKALIVFENVGKIYRTGQVVYEALHDVDLRIRGEELPGIWGRR